MTTTVYDVRFYYRYISKDGKNGLDREEGLTPFSFVVCWERVTQRGTFRLFTFFDSVVNFTSWLYNKVPGKEWTFHEVIREDTIQKVRFDIDIELKDLTSRYRLVPHQQPPLKELGERVQSSLIKAIQIVIPHIDLSRDILICDSTDETKFSRHVILPNHSTADSNNALEYFKMIIRHCSPEAIQFIDEGVYSSKHNLRLLGSVKTGTRRRKVLMERWMLDGEVIAYKYPQEPRTEKAKFALQMSESAVTNAFGCEILPYIETVRKRIDKDIEDQLAHDVLKFYAERMGADVNAEGFPYTLTGVAGNFVLLKRERPTKCPICLRPHENENPYLIVSGETRKVSFSCRRSPKLFFVGEMNPKVQEITLTVQPRGVDEKRMEKLTGVAASRDSISLVGMLSRNVDEPVANDPVLDLLRGVMRK